MNGVQRRAHRWAWLVLGPAMLAGLFLALRSAPTDPAAPAAETAP